MNTLAGPNRFYIADNYDITYAKTHISKLDSVRRHVLYDLFICHATEDKETFVRPLVAALQQQNVEVWFDEFTLIVGESLRESIDKGLSQSRFGVVILSPAFFQKRWPARELNGLVAREMAGEGKLILPIWHGVTYDRVVRFSPPLADVRAIDSTKGIPQVVKNCFGVSDHNIVR